MRHSEPNGPTPPIDVSESIEARLRKENEELRERLRRLEGSLHGEIPEAHLKLWRPSRLTITAIFLTGLVLLIIAFLAGFLPFHRRSALITEEARNTAEALPRVEVITVSRSARKAELDLPGNIQAMTGAPVLARANAGQPLAVIETPELDEQVRQAEATLQQARSSVAQAEANLRQGRSDLEFARVTAKRWEHLVSDGSVSVQENDQYQAQYRSKIAEVQSLEQALDVQRNGVAVAQANLARVEKMKAYQVVTAPFNGVITLRNIDSGALVNNGATLLFRIAQTGTLRTYVNVPQSYADSVHRGDPAVLTVSNLPGQRFAGTVARTADALDPASRTLLAEVHVPNREGRLLPGMYAQVALTTSRIDPPLLIPSDALVLRSEGPQVAVVDRNHRVHLTNIKTGRDYGDRLEVNSGIRDGDSIVANPGDVLADETEVDPVPVTR
jgi:RND family efflux transporter MFP subunit